MRRWYRTAGKWALSVVLFVIVLVALDVLALAFPYPLFPHRARFGEFTICSTGPLPENLDRVVEGVRARIEAMEYGRPGAHCRVFICGGERLYGFFAFLTRRAPNSLGIGMSMLGNMYLNESKIRRFAAQNTRGIRHSRYEGNLAEVIAHEIAHFNVVKRVGFWKAMHMPFWKSEGYAEYQANLAAVRADTTYDFTDRVDLALDYGFWSRGSIARRLFEWHLLVEFLAEEKGYGLDDLMDESVTEAWAREEMLDWYEQAHNPSGS